MNRFKKVAALMTLASILCASTSAFAEDNAFRDTFQSAFYGGAVGALVGAALLAFARKPADHLDYMGIGAAAGVLAGTAYGVGKATRALASIENGTFKMAIPTVIPDLTESPTSKQMAVSWRADILRGTFD
ncbi:MAG: hypothetical protein M0T70_15370 [Geobacteraceae bacterium]|nr:hypothetical protein [Geobacteraceae bacterium]